MAIVEARMVRKFRFEMSDAAASRLMRMYAESDAPFPEIGDDPEFDAAFNIAIEAFLRWKWSEDGDNASFTFDENADCVVGSEALHGFEIIPESALNDGTPIV